MHPPAPRHGEGAEAGTPAIVVAAAAAELGGLGPPLPAPRCAVAVAGTVAVAAAAPSSAHPQGCGLYPTKPGNL